MEKHRCVCLLQTPCVLLFLALFGHVTHGFILLTHTGNVFGNTNNFTVVDIDNEDNFKLPIDVTVTSFPDTHQIDDSLLSYYKNMDETITLTHDTQTPVVKNTNHFSKSLDISPNQHNHHHRNPNSPMKRKTPSNNGIDQDASQDVSMSHNSWSRKTTSSNGNPSTQTQKKSEILQQTENRNSSDPFPVALERQDIVEIPRPLRSASRGHSSRQGLRSRVKRRARPSVIVRVPPSPRFLRSGIQTYVRSPRQSRVDAQVGVLVVADHSVYQHYLKTSLNNHRVAVARIRRYFGMVFAMMNERFGTIKDPNLSIKVTISGILIAEKRSDSPWTEDIVNWSTKTYHGRASVDTGKSLRGFSQWLDGREGLPEFDHAMVFTAYRLTDPYGVGLGGMAYLEAVCDTKTGNAVSIVGDKGDFQSVRVATHELAHSLGATHDGERGAEDCPSSDAFIMSSMTTHNQHAPLQNAFYFSKCSIRDMIKHLSKSRSSCVKDKPPLYYSYDLARFPPGRTYSPDTQCKLIFGVRSSFCGNGNLASVMCGQLWCRDPNRDNGCRTNSYLTALPGTKCGDYGVCSLGECQPDTFRENNEKSSSSRSSIDNHNTHNTSNDLRPSARIGGTSRQQRPHSDNKDTSRSHHRGGSRGPDSGRVDGGLTSRNEALDNDRSIRGDSVINRGNGINSDAIKHNRDNVVSRGYGGSNTGSKEIRTDRYEDGRDREIKYNTVETVRNKYRTLSRDSTISRDADAVRRDNVYNRGSTISRDSAVRRDSTYNRGSTVSRDSAVSRDNTYNRGGTVTRDSAIRRDNIYNRGSTISRDSAVRRDSTYNRGSTTRRDSSIRRDNNNYHNRDNTIDNDSTIRRYNTYNRGGTISKDRSINRGTVYDRGNTISKDPTFGRNTYNRSSTISRVHTVNRNNDYGRGSTVSKDSGLSRSNDYNRGSTISRDSNVNMGSIYSSRRTSSRDRDISRDNIYNRNRQDTIGRDSSYKRDSTYNRDRTTYTDTRINRGNSADKDRTFNRNSGLYENRVVNRNGHHVVRDSRVTSTASNERERKKDSRIYSDSRITNYRNIHRDSRTNRDNSYTRDRGLNNGSDISRGSKIDNKGSTTNTSLTRGVIRNVSSRKRTNAIPKSHDNKYSRSSRRLRKQRRRRHRSRTRSLSGSQRSGRRNRKRSKGKKKNRCREDKNVSYCRGLIDLNPDGCRRKAIRQYCCATCRWLRKSKKRASPR